jgi:hypothetical protein
MFHTTERSRAWVHNRHMLGERKTRANELLQAMLPSFLKPGTRPDSAAYELRTKFEETGLAVKADVEGDLGFMLCHQGIMIACIGFEVVPEFTILQLQGTRGQAACLARLRWECLLVELVVALMEEHETVYLMATQSIHWYHRPHKREAMSLDEFDRHQRRMRFRYNGTAVALNFRYDHDKQLWFRTRPRA